MKVAPLVVAALFATRLTVLEIKILVLRGSLDDALRKVRDQRPSLR